MAVIPKSNIAELMKDVPTNSISLVATLEKRRDDFLSANNLSDQGTDVQKFQYAWAKGIYDDAIMVVQAYK
jgi:hypothetical protein